MSSKKQIGPIWTKEEEELGRLIVNTARSLAGDASFIEKCSQVAREIDPETYKHLSLKRFEIYTDLPKGTRSFISFLGGKNSHRNRNKGGLLGTPSSAGMLGAPPSLGEQWKSDIRTCKTLQHSLHPEDDQSLIAWASRE